MRGSNFIATLNVDPVFPTFWLTLLVCLSVLFLGFAYWQDAKALAFRLLLLASIFLLMLNPSILSENRTYLKDIVLLIIDKSTSQNVGNRPEQLEMAKNKVLQELEKFTNLEVQIREVKPSDTTHSARLEGTRLFEARAAALDSLPQERIAATILISDGQIHDADTIDLKNIGEHGPIHSILTGNKNEIDRVISLEMSPTYGIINKLVKLQFMVKDYATELTSKTVVVTVQLDGKIIGRVAAITGQTEELEIFIPHGGANHVILEVEPLINEISKKNNLVVAAINGIRDRLKVLLVSGEPYMGERGWRNILKSDPSVELVHFTILRPPEKQDGTPLKELSLIPFPIVELFENKLDEFDLIIFDRYRKRGVLSTRYLNNIVSYVQNGGALLESIGPAFATPLSLYRTPLSTILPGRPTGTVFEQPFIPSLNEIGKRHPVTASLQQDSQTKKWGRWFRMIDTDIKSGTVLMTGPSDRPLLVLTRQGEGRVAQLMSDHAWLWGRGFEGGGPQAELFRRIAHWLMKEPELEEEQLTAISENAYLHISRRSLSNSNDPVQIEAPDGTTTEIILAPSKNGTQTGRLPLSGRGLYKLESAGKNVFVAVGSPNPLEERDIRATDKHITASARKSGGGIHWIADGPLPSFKRTSPSAQQATKFWWGLQSNKRYQINGYTKTPLIPPLLGVLLLIGGICIVWWREGR